MNWTLLGGAALLVLLVVARMGARRWIFAKWMGNEITDARAKLLLFLVTFGPIMAAGAWLAALAPFPNNLLILGAVTLGLAPGLGLASAVFDYASKYVVMRDAPAERHD